ncbi:MAG: type ISP restriction/modification enzyme [Candidatus Dormibacteria bacterium]
MPASTAGSSAAQRSGKTLAGRALPTRPRVWSTPAFLTPEAAQGRTRDRSRLQVNDHLTLSRIPEEAWAYRLGSRPALQLVIDRLKPSTDKASGIENDPNDLSDDPRDAVDLVKRVVRVAVDTMRLVSDLRDSPVVHPGLSHALWLAEPRRGRAAHWGSVQTQSLRTDTKLTSSPGQKSAGVIQRRGLVSRKFLLPEVAL